MYTQLYSFEQRKQWRHKIYPINHFGTLIIADWEKSIKFRFIENKKSDIIETGLDVFNNYITTKYWSILRPLLLSFNNKKVARDEVQHFDQPSYFKIILVRSTIYVIIVTYYSFWPTLYLLNYNVQI